MTKTNQTEKQVGFNFTIRQLLEAGVHFGHKTSRRNPKMDKYIFGVRNNLNIIDLTQTEILLQEALLAIRRVAAKNGKILFVATKRQAATIIADSAKRCGQYYVNHRWLGGMLTNWKTVSKSIKTLETIEAQLANEESGLIKKERLMLDRDRSKLELSLGGIRNMGKHPDLIIVIDTNKEDLAVKDGIHLGIPIVAILDTNSNPEGISYPIPGNDDSSKSINLYCSLFTDAILSGLEEFMIKSGIDVKALNIEAMKNN